MLRAAISATALQRFEKAIMHCEKGIASSGGDDKEDKDNLTLFQKTKAGAERARENAAKKEQEAAARENAAELADKRRTETLVKRGVEMGLALFAQQRSYATTCVTIGDDGLTWPVLVLYPEEAIGISGVGDQSDYLEHVHEETTLLDIVRTLFPPKEQGPEWDKRGVYSSFDKLEVLFRGDWTMTEDEADSDDERTYVGSMRGPEEVGAWRTLDTSLTLRKAIATNGYVVPLFPVFYVVPKGVYLS